MKTAPLFLAASMAGAVVAQSLSSYFPQCSLDCLEQATEKATDCSTTDAVCFCVQSNYEAIYNAGLSCVLKACGPDVSVDKVLPAAIQFCSAASASASATASATSPAAADSTSEATTTPTPKSTNAVPTTEASETAAPQTTSSAQSSTAPTTSAATSSSTVASGRPVSSPSTTTSFSTGAAAAAAGPMATAVMLVAGAVAML